jgi:hypothetical protein
MWEENERKKTVLGYKIKERFSLSTSNLSICIVQKTATSQNWVIPY